MYRQERNDTRESVYYEYYGCYRIFCTESDDVEVKKRTKIRGQREEEGFPNPKNQKLRNTLLIITPDPEELFSSLSLVEKWTIITH